MSSSSVRRNRPIRSGNNSTSTEKTAERLRNTAHRFNLKFIIILSSVVLAFVVVALGVLWFNKIYADPEHVFWSTMRNNLSTYGVTKEIKQKSSAASNDELTQLIFNPDPRIRDIKKVTTGSGSAITHLTLESVGTPRDDYQHYTQIDRPATAGKPKSNYSSVYSLWLHNGGNASSSGSALFGNAIFGAALFGNLPQKERTTTVQYLRSAYHVDFANVKRQTENGRRIYTYDVVLSLQDYANAAHLYAMTIGLPTAAQISPSNYRPTDRISLTLTIDVLSREVKQIVYKSSNITENYSGYGILADITPPAHTVSYQKLQDAINQVSK